MIEHTIYGDLVKANEDIIVHQVNCQGVMGSGVAKCIRQAFPIVYDKYKELCMKSKPQSLLGVVQFVNINETQQVVNMFSQLNFGYDGRQYTDLSALEKALISINNSATNKSIAFPYNIGCVRGGANWDDVYNLIIKNLTNVKSITFYKLDNN